MKSLRDLFNGSDKLNPLLMHITLILIFVVFVMNLWSSISNSQPLGDEGFYLNELERIHNDGLWTAFSDGISHLFMWIWYLISLTGTNGLVGMRAISILLAFVSMYIIYYLLKKTTDSRALLLVAISTAAYVFFVTKTGRMFYLAINDTLMNALGLAAILFLSKYFDQYRIKHLVIAALFSGMMFWVRSFSILIFGGLFISVILIPLLHDPKRLIKQSLRSLLFIFVFVIVMISVQIPSIIDNQRLSFEKKNLSGDWGARNWITRLERKPSGSIFAYERSSWEYVDRYIEEQGEDSIPRGFFGRVKADPKFMVDNLASNLFVRVPYIILISIGFLGIGLLRILRVPEKWVSKLTPTELLCLTVFMSVGLGVSLVIINYIEHRWLFMICLTGLFLGVKSICGMSANLQRLLIRAQFVFMILLTSMTLLTSITQ
jgi:hypothetical protein